MRDAPNTDDPDVAENNAADSSNATDNDSVSAYSKKHQYLLRKRNKYFKNSHNTEELIKKPLIPPMVMPFVLLKMLLLMPPILMMMILDPHTPKHPHIHWETTIIPPMLLIIMLNSLIDSKLNRKIDPRWIIKLKQIKKTVTDFEVLENNVHHDLMNTNPHVTNASTDIDT